MILVVESNFVFELAFQREEAMHVERILDLAENRRIELVVPACALFEPFESLIRREKVRNQVVEKLKQQVNELGRSAHFAALDQLSAGLIRALTSSFDTERAALDLAIRRILNCAHVIALSPEILRTSFAAREQFRFGPQDSIIFASVDWYLKQDGKEGSIFANRNSKDFEIPAVADHFAALNCKVLPSFADSVGLILHRTKAH